MRKLLKKTFLIIQGFLIAFPTISCDFLNKTEDDSGSGIAPIENVKQGLTLNYSEKELLFGDSLSLIASFERKDGNVLTFSSSNPSVCSVSNDGDVVSLKVGKSTITATYGDLKATCDITVSFGNLYPSLIVNNVSNDSIKLCKDSSYKLNNYVLFNSNKYTDGYNISYSSSDDTIATVNNGVIETKKIGSCTIYLNSSWMSFTGATMSKEIDLVVTDDLILNTYGNNEIVSNVDLSLVDTFNGINYQNEITFNTKAIKNNQEVAISSTIYSKDPGCDIIEIDDNKITALGLGNAKVYATSIVDGTTYVDEININVYCPTVKYDDVLEIETTSSINTSDVFGKGSVILDAYQGNKKLNVVSGKYVEGIVPNGYQTEKVTILSSLGGYEFDSVYAYTNLIETEDEFKSVFTLKSGKVIDGYYVLKNDITVDMDTQIDSLYIESNKTNRYFEGVFDGYYHEHYHTINATVYQNGLFGGIGNGSIIKNTAFNFTFAFKENVYTSCGLARNAGAVFIKTTTNNDVLLSNIKVTTTNYFDGSDSSNKRSYSLFDFMNYRLMMEDIYVKLSGTGVNYTNYTQQVGALFRVDSNSMCSSCDAMYRYGWKNINVVTGVFMPISNGQYGSYDNDTKLSYYTTYSLLDCYSKSSSNQAIVGKHNGTSENTGYCKIFVDTTTTDSQKDLFGKVYYIEPSTGLVESSTYTWVYYSLINNGGVYRYNTINELKGSGKTKIGSWEVN